MGALGLKMGPEGRNIAAHAPKDSTGGSWSPSGSPISAAATNHAATMTEAPQEQEQLDDLWKNRVLETFSMGCDGEIDN